MPSDLPRVVRPRTPPNPIRAAGLGLLALVIILGAWLPAAAQDSSPPTARPESWIVPEQTAICDFGRPDSAIERAQNDLAFIGTVTGFVRHVQGEPIVTTTPPVTAVLEIAVDRVLKGDLPASIRFRYQGDCANTQRKEAVRWPLPGDRSVFFPRRDPGTENYFGDSVFAVIPIKSAKQEERLIARFGSGGTAGEAENGPRCFNAAREQPTELAREPETSRPGDLVRITGGPFPRGWVIIRWDDRESWRTGESVVRRVWVGKDCQLDATLSVPAAMPGRHQISVYDTQARTHRVSVAVEAPVQNTPRQPNAACQTLMTARASQRAMAGEIFVGTVLGPAERNRPANRPPEDVPGYLRYAVAVNTTVRGGASGEERVLFHGACQGIVHERDARAPQPGERFLFFADRDPDQQRLYVDPVAGLTRIASPEQEAELIAAYAAVVSWMDVHPGLILPPGDCALITEPPEISVTPNRVRPGETLDLSGGSFSALVPTLPIEIGGKAAGIGAVGRGCQLSANLTVPDLEPGRYRLTVEDAEGATVSATIEVVDETGKRPKPRQRQDRSNGEGE